MTKGLIGVIDIETTGFFGEGKIVEVGIAGLYLKTGRVFPLFNSLCKEPGLTAKDRNAWIFHNSDMKPDDVRETPLLEDIKDRIQNVISNVEAVTAFNKDFDMKFLRSRGFNIEREWPCPMNVATPVCKMPKKDGKRGYKFPSVEEAWHFFFPEEKYVEEHRGLDDALHEAKIIYELYKQGYIRA